jgi:chloramphenicol 3-O phosphotransferase
VDLLFLNGPSSAGKTSIARQLQHGLDTYYLYFGIDAFMAMMPAKSNQWEGAALADGFSWQEVDLPNGTTGKLVVGGWYGKRIELAFRAAVVALLNDGVNLIVDNVIDGNREIQEWRALLSRYNCCYIGVYCSLDILNEREIARQNRNIGSAAEQYFRTHKDVEYDITVNSGENDTTKCVEQIMRHLATD